jgi:hypothetical protein
MTELGDDFELKPVFLFLSMLHADEAKAAAAGENRLYIDRMYPY